MFFARTANSPSSVPAAVLTFFVPSPTAVRDVTGIEINPIIATTIMRGRYADYSYRLYEQPEVHIHVTDGRSFVRNASQQFDVVQMTLVDTWASTAAGAFALSENSLYTVEAFRQYFEHLKPDGHDRHHALGIPHNRVKPSALSPSATEALHQLGARESELRNFIVVSEGAFDEDGIPVVVLAKKSPFTPAEEQAVLTPLAKPSATRARFILPCDARAN